MGFLDGINERSVRKDRLHLATAQREQEALDTEAAFRAVQDALDVMPQAFMKAGVPPAFGDSFVGRRPIPKAWRIGPATDFKNPSATRLSQAYVTVTPEGHFYHVYASIGTWVNVSTGDSLSNILFPRLTTKWGRARDERLKRIKWGAAKRIDSRAAVNALFYSISLRDGQPHGSWHHSSLSSYDEMESFSGDLLSHLQWIVNDA